MSTITLLVAVAVVGAARPEDPASSTPSDQPLRFRTIDLFVDPGDVPLAAYQLSLRAVGGEVKIVGIEGGQHPQFAKPPYYDPKAMQRDHVILAAFSTAPASELPKEGTRVATIHVQARGDEPPRFEVKSQVAATVDGKGISVTVSAVERKPE